MGSMEVVSHIYAWNKMRYFPHGQGYALKKQDAEALKVNLGMWADRAVQLNDLGEGHYEWTFRDISEQKREYIEKTIKKTLNIELCWYGTKVTTIISDGICLGGHLQ